MPKIKPFTVNDEKPKRKRGRQPKNLKNEEKTEEPNNNMTVRIEYKPHIIEI